MEGRTKPRKRDDTQYVRVRSHLSQMRREPGGEKAFPLSYLSTTIHTHHHHIPKDRSDMREIKNFDDGNKTSATTKEWNVK